MGAVRTAIETPVKDDVIRVRVTAEQKNAIVAAAERDGLEMSAWLRQLALRAAGALPSSTRHDLGWTLEFAEKTRSALDTFASDWDDPTMDVYDLR